MAPSLTDQGFKSSKIKGLFSKIMTSKGKIKKDSGYRLDSNPDYFYEESTQQPNQEKTSTNEETTAEKEQSSEKTHEEVREEDILKEEREERKEQKEKMPRGRKNNFQDEPSVKNINIQMMNGGSLQIGTKTIINQTSYYKQTFNASSPSKKGEKGKPSAEIEAIIRSKEKLRSPHIQFLSEHFGKSCREIGLKLELTNGEIDKIESDCEKDFEQISFEMLSLWKRRRGDKATVGRLCVVLWNSQIPRAREALQKFAEVIDDFN